jgi:hypothetical protein
MSLGVLSFFSMSERGVSLFFYQSACAVWLAILLIKPRSMILSYIQSLFLHISTQANELHSTTLFAFIYLTLRVSWFLASYAFLS